MTADDGHAAAQRQQLTQSPKPVTRFGLVGLSWCVAASKVAHAETLAH
jgi:hypothetical protein